MNALRFKIMLVMLLCLLVCIGFIFTNQLIHEVFGGIFLTSVVIHLWMNRWFLKSILKRSPSIYLSINKFITLILLAVFLILCICGLINSQCLFPFFHAVGGSTARDLHAVAAYWCLILIGLHMGMHWWAIKKYPILHRVNNLKWHGFNIFVSVMELGVFVFGGWAFTDREIISKLFFGVGFEFWEKRRPQLFFYWFMLSIIIAIALLTKTIARYFGLIKRSKN